MWKTLGKRILKSVLISCIVYLSISLILIYWPIHLTKNVKNYDFSSVKPKIKPRFGQEVWIKMRDKKQIFARLYPSESRDVMILMHGSGSESRYLANFADSLSKYNVATVLTPDVRGHGRNSGKQGEIDYIGQLEHDLEDLIQYSKINLKARKIILAGHSSGGGFVLRFIGNPLNSRVDKAILLAPYLGHDAPTVKPSSGGWVKVAMPRIIGLSMLNNVKIRVLNDLPVLFFNRPAQLNDSLQVPSYSFNLLINFNPKNHVEEIKNISIPCLVLVGKKDEGFYPDQFPIVFQSASHVVELALLDKIKHLDLVSSSTTLHYIRTWHARTR